LTAVQDEIKDQRGLLQNMMDSLHAINENLVGQEDYDEVEIEEGPAHNTSTLIDSFIIDVEDGSGEDFNEDPGLIDELFSPLNQVPEYGVALSSKVAENFKNLTSSECDKEVLEKMKNEYKIPENGKSLGVPRVNPELWQALTPKDKSMDGKIQYLQQHLSRALIAQGRLADGVLKLAQDKKLNKEDLKILFTPLLDSASNIGWAQKDLNNQRRMNLRASHPAISSIATSSTPVTEFLFGDNFDQDLRSAQASARLVRGGTRGVSQRYHPYNRPVRFSRPNAGSSVGSPSLNSGGGQQRFRGWRGQRGNRGIRGRAPPNFRR
jgi:hypothetical protein